MTTLIAYTESYQDWRLGDDHPTNPVRARNAVAMLQKSMGDKVEVWNSWDDSDNREDWAREATRVHSTRHVEDTLAGYSGEWAGKNRMLGQTALTMFGGTVSLVESFLSGTGERVMFNPQGAKHHAQWDKSSGFCVFNDMAWAALRLADMDYRVAYVDWDAHHGDGVENLLQFREDILTCSIHDGTIFPGTGHTNGPGRYNWSLKEGAGDAELLEAMDEVVFDLNTHGADFVLLACGADGLNNDPLSTLRYSHTGLDEAALKLKSFIGSDIPILIGGAGGYQPHDETPEHWARVVEILS